MANAVAAFLDEPIAAGAGDHPAIVTPAGTTTYRGLLAAVNRVGHALQALGVEPEQRVAILLPDSLPWAAVFFGTLRIGAIAVPLNAHGERPAVLGRAAPPCCYAAESVSSPPLLRGTDQAEATDEVLDEWRPQLHTSREQQMAVRSEWWKQDQRGVTSTLPERRVHLLDHRDREV